jgi:hypothetical protein
MAKLIVATNDVPTASQVNEWMININCAFKPNFTDRSSTTTLTPDPDLSIPVVANAVYVMQSSLLVHSTDPAAGDFKMQFTAPAGSVLLGTAVGFTSTATLNTNVVAAGFTLNTVPTFGIGVATAEPWNPVHLQGLLNVGGSSGNFVLTWSQVTSSATITRLQTNSFVSLRRVS